MATKAQTPTDSTANEAPATPVASAKAEAAPVEAGQTQIHYVPEYGVSIEAASSEEALEKAKELKGVK